MAGTVMAQGNGSGVDWDPVLQEGAEAAARAMGEAFGGAIGGAVVDALLGKSGPSAFEANVMSTLNRIDTKLDQVLTFIYTKLPEVVTTAVKKEIITASIHELKSNLTVLQAELAPFQGTTVKPSEHDMSRVLDGAKDCFRLGEQILRYGQEWYLAGIHAFCAGYAGYVYVSRYRVAYKASLEVYAQKYVELMAPWVQKDSPDGLSFTDVLKRARDNLAAAQSNLEPLRTTSKEYLVQMVSRPPNSAWGARPVLR